MTEYKGILQTKDYENFIILSDSGETLYTFTGAKLANKCLQGDHIKWNNQKQICELELRDEYPVIVGTIELTNKSRYGLTSRGIPIYLFTPYDKKYPHFIVGCSEKDTTKNKIAIIKFDNWQNNSTFPRGQLQQLLGNSGDYEAELQALIYQASPVKYPKGNWEPKTKEEFERKHLTGYTINIDPEGCKDIDDVLTFEREGNNYRITITISDVARYIEDSSVEDIFASLIGQTLYMDGKVVRPMLPEQYSEEVCSLKPGKQSHGISLQMLWNPTEKNITELNWFESTLVNDRAFTYEEFSLENKENIKEEYIVEYIEVLKELASHLAGKNTEDSHKWIEECMKFYNIETAKMLKTAKMGILRKHSEPDLKRLEEYRQNLPELEKFAYSSAEYCLAEDEHTKHYGLNTETYTHATSPIRRYADLVNQRIIKNILKSKRENTELETYIVPQAMYDMNLRQKAVKRFERDLLFLRAIQNDKREFIGTIVSSEIDISQSIMKIQVYIKGWNKIISTKYKLIDEHTIISRDEKSEIHITKYEDVIVKVAFNLNARSWKDRAIIHLSNTKALK